MQVRPRTPDCKTDDTKIGGGSDVKSRVVGKGFMEEKFAVPGKVGSGWPGMGILCIGAKSSGLECGTVSSVPMCPGIGSCPTRLLYREEFQAPSRFSLALASVGSEPRWGGSCSVPLTFPCACALHVPRSQHTCVTVSFGMSVTVSSLRGGTMTYSSCVDEI